MCCAGACYSEQPAGVQPLPHSRCPDRRRRFLRTWAVANSITPHFTDLGEVLGPHLDLFLHELLPVEGFILQPLLRLLPPSPLLLQHLTASQALPLLEDRAFIKYFFWSVRREKEEEKKKTHMLVSLTLRPELSLTFIHLCTSFSCWDLPATGRLLKEVLLAICRSNAHGTTRTRTRQKRNAKDKMQEFESHCCWRFNVLVTVWGDKRGRGQTILFEHFCRI